MSIISGGTRASLEWQKDWNVRCETFVWLILCGRPDWTVRFTLRKALWRWRTFNIRQFFTHQFWHWPRDCPSGNIYNLVGLSFSSLFFQRTVYHFGINTTKWIWLCFCFRSAYFLSYNFWYNSRIVSKKRTVRVGHCRLAAFGRPLRTTSR